jgi:four helix bundle protein
MAFMFENLAVIARGSAQECVPLLELARRKNLVQQPVEAELRSQIEIIAKMISGLLPGGYHSR